MYIVLIGGRCQPSSEARGVQLVARAVQCVVVREPLDTQERVRFRRLGLQGLDVELRVLGGYDVGVRVRRGIEAQLPESERRGLLDTCGIIGLSEQYRKGPQPSVPRTVKERRLCVIQAEPLWRVGAVGAGGCGSAEARS